MQKLQIKNYQTGAVIYEGSFRTARDCIERAACEGVNLDYADLHHTNLTGAMLDDIVMRHARLEGANLSGANLSEACLDGTSFVNATIYGTCLCFSSLKNCDFRGSSFGATDIAGTVMQKCPFSTLSAFSLNFIDTNSLENCSFENSKKQSCPFSKAPLVITGLSLPVIFLDQHLKIGSLVKTYENWMGNMNDNAPSHKKIKNNQTYSFFRKYQPMFREMHEGQHKKITSGMVCNTELC